MLTCCSEVPGPGGCGHLGSLWLIGQKDSLGEGCRGCTRSFKGGREDAPPLLPHFLGF